MGSRSSNSSQANNSSINQNVNIQIDNISIFQPPQCLRMIKCHSSIQKNTLSLIKDSDSKYNLSFRYDSETDCQAIFYLAAKDEPEITL